MYSYRSLAFRRVISSRQAFQSFLKHSTNYEFLASCVLRLALRQYYRYRRGLLGTELQIRNPDVETSSDRARAVVVGGEHHESPSARGLVRKRLKDLIELMIVILQLVKSSCCSGRRAKAGKLRLGHQPSLYGRAHIETWRALGGFKFSLDSRNVRRYTKPLKGD